MWKSESSIFQQLIPTHNSISRLSSLTWKCKSNPPANPGIIDFFFSFTLRFDKDAAGLMVLGNKIEKWKGFLNRFSPLLGDEKDSSNTEILFKISVVLHGWPNAFKTTRTLPICLKGTTQVETEWSV